MVKHPIEIFYKEKISELKQSIDTLTDMKSCLSDVDNRRKDLDIAIDLIKRQIRKIRARYL